MVARSSIPTEHPRPACADYRARRRTLVRVRRIRGPVRRVTRLLRLRVSALGLLRDLDRFDWPVDSVSPAFVRLATRRTLCFANGMERLVRASELVCWKLIQ